jgi:hypothetical protein
LGDLGNVLVAKPNRVVSSPMYLVSCIRFIIKANQTTSEPTSIAATFTQSSFGDALVFEVKHCRQPTLAFSFGARSASDLKERSYLRNMLPRRQLQGFVGSRHHRRRVRL